MEKRTLDALKDSIEKWEQNAKINRFGSAIMGRKGCPLCEIFNNDGNMEKEFRCVGCPVFEKAERQFCADTPYEEAEMLWDDWEQGESDDEFSGRLGYKKDVRFFRAHARREVKFLKSLLPEGEGA